VVPATVPDCSQEETADALRCQVDWLAREIGVADSFFARIVGTDEATFSRWRVRAGELPPDGEEILRHLWRTLLHLLSFLNFDEVRVRDLFRQTVPGRPPGEESSLTPPWAGSSLTGYLERGQSGALAKVEAWVTGLRFGDLYAA
jgi:hypothetical protein